MDYKFLDSLIDKDNLILPDSDKINHFLIKNHQAEIIKALDFLEQNEKFLYIHGFMGTGKRQFVNYLCEFLSKDVIKLEYYCKQATVCDDILLTFTDLIENNSLAKVVNLNSKITTLSSKLQKQISSIKKPFLIILHSFDDILEENKSHIIENLTSLLKEENVKLIISTRALDTDILGEISEDRKIFLNCFTKEIFKDFLSSNNIDFNDKTLEDFYNLTRGYYYYTALTVKILQTENCNLAEFIQKIKQSGMSFDSYLAVAYVNLLPTAIRNFFWFLRTVRHGLSFNALAVFDIFDEFSIEFLKSNLIIFQVDETIYVQDFFLQDLDFSIPHNTQVRLHKYIVNIYEKQLKESLKTRSIQISRQALRAEIEYHTQMSKKAEKEPKVPVLEEEIILRQENKPAKEMSLEERKKEAYELLADKKYQLAIEKLSSILDLENIDTQNVVEIRLKLAHIHNETSNYQMACHYYELVEVYYKQNKENINLNYLYYDMANLYHKMYKNERAIDTIKKVIYSVDTPQSLMVSACTMLGNIYSDSNNSEEAYSYYKKALESLDESVENSTLAELYFKFALANDDKEDFDLAFEYYSKCISVSAQTHYYVLAYSNLASCYYEKENYDDALDCFIKAYKIEKNNNNFDGIYYTALHIAKIYTLKGSKQALDYLIEAKKSAEFINEDFYIMQASIALGDYYYSRPANYKDGLTEYFKAKSIAKNNSLSVDISKIERRIQDMKLRMDKNDYLQIERKYDKKN